MEDAGRRPVVEAVVGAECPVLGVQWHPEQLPAGDLAGDGPFAWLRDRLAAPAGRA